MFETGLYVACILLTLGMLVYVLHSPLKGEPRFHEEDEI